jgi:hypothetical protein
MIVPVIGPLAGGSSRVDSKNPELFTHSRSTISTWLPMLAQMKEPRSFRSMPSSGAPGRKLTRTRCPGGWLDGALAGARAWMSAGTRGIEAPRPVETCGIQYVSETTHLLKNEILLASRERIDSSAVGRYSANEPKPIGLVDNVPGC